MIAQAVQQAINKKMKKNYSKLLEKMTCFLKDMKKKSGNVQFSTLNQAKSKKKSHHARRCPIFHAKASEEQKKKMKPIIAKKLH